MNKDAAYRCALCGECASGGITVGSTLTARDLDVEIGDYVCPDCYDYPEDLEDDEEETE